MASSEDLNEFVVFLDSNQRIDLRSLTLHHLLSLTGTKEGRDEILKHPVVYKAVMKLFDDPQAAVRKDAYLFFLNLTADESVSRCLLNADSFGSELVCSLLRYILNRDSDFADVACTVLSNLTRLKDAAEKVFELTEKNEEIDLNRIVRALCLKDFNAKKNKLDYLAPLLCNLTQSAACRAQILNPESGLFLSLLPFTTFSESVIRRGGICGLIKNCCFDTKYHEWLLDENQADVLPKLLLPLAGPEELDADDNEKLPIDLQYLEPTKARESDPDIRRILIEALTQLCATKHGRDILKRKNAYVILREYHKWENDRANDIACEDLVQILIGDEPPPEMENLHQLDVPEDLVKQFTEEKTMVLEAEGEKES